MHVCHGALDEDRFLALFGRQGQLQGAVGNKRPRQLLATRKLLAARATLEEAIKAAKA